MFDMSQVIIAKSDQINAIDLIGENRTIRITGVNVQPGEDQPVVVKVEGDKKFYRPCKSMCRVMVAAWGADSAKYAGRSMTLYYDPDVLWAGAKVGGIRISHMSHIDGPVILALAENKKNRKWFTVKPLPTQRTNPPAASIPDAAAVTPPTDAGQSTGAASNEDKARAWLASTSSLIDDCNDRASLAELQAKRAAGLEKARAMLPDDAALIDAAYAIKLAAFGKMDGDAFDAATGEVLAEY